ncbi:hypothetical protein IGB42_02282 [Andreprevotia sp. IGB-42]|uniref:DUF883 family protein n=1 Tax=Andreprevotia sp. IGB-42 TaxID=2497473 RepID=UPI00135C11F6|nr:DUF883 family protein [Andreprevotia sp. IGB-42]KAF0813353.1 hypothetical protein IGB42_02282 [Andreprevotia sp. IGB-42]
MANDINLAADLRTVVADTERVLNNALALGGEATREVTDQLSLNLQLLKNTLADTEQKIIVKARAAAAATDNYVHDNPWRSIGVAAGVGFLLGLLTCRR